jgi:DNA-directed RNA polymerase subunit beta'
VKAIAQDPALTGDEKNKRIVSAMQKADKKIQEAVLREGLGKDNVFAKSIDKGFRGSPSQLIQLIFGDRLLTDHKDQIVPFPGLTGYGAGVDPMEYFAGTYGARKGYWAVQKATAASGFFGKQLSASVRDLRVDNDDEPIFDGRGLPVSGDDPDIVGRVLAYPIAGLKAGHVIEKDDLKVLAGKEPVIRSVTTDLRKRGISAASVGRRGDGRFPQVGENIGIEQARVVSEPLTQLGLSSKHVGGQAGVTDQTVTGFDAINQIFQVPSRFPGGAAISPVDGTVSSITEASQGGQYLQVGDQEVYVPRGLELKVKKGDKVEAGDIMSSGLPNPAAIAQHKGIGEARRQFIRQFRELLEENNVPTHRRNLESLATGFINRVKITDPRGVANYATGTVVPYHHLEEDYKPREDARKVSPKRAVGNYLEQPVLHYTIGTRITPRVAEEMQRFQVPEVLTHKQSPGFEPSVNRLMTMSMTSPDWKDRMSGFYLKQSFLDAAQRGAVSPKDSPSPVRFLMNPAEQS